ncbi:MAG: ATP-binding protein, partial [Opitutales bacterium]
GFKELAGRHVGVVRSSGAHNWLLRQHPEVNIVPVTNTAQGLRLLSLNRLDAMLEALPVAAYVIAEEGYTNVRALPEIVYTVPQYLAVRRGDEILRTILQKGLASVPPEERLRIFARWTGEDPAKPRQFVSPWVWRSVVVLLLAVAGFAAWNFALRRQVARHTRDLQESEHQFRRLLEDLPLAAAWADETGRMEFLNRAFITLFGYTLNDVPTVEQWFERAYPDTAYRQQVVGEWQARMDQARRQGGASQPVEVRVTCRDQSIRTVSITGCFTANKVFALFDDITERVHIEQRLRQAQKMEAIGQLAGGVAHDFNNLLTVVLGHSSLLLHDPGLSDDTRHSIQQVADVARRAAGLTRQLLTFSRQQAMQPRLLDLGETMQAVSGLLSRLLGEQISIELDCSPALPPVYADPGMIEQVVLNLAVNARDAMPRGGRLIITIRAEEVRPPDLLRRPANARTGRYVVLAVTDTGTGIDPAALPHLFEPFFTTKEVGKGTGLGLATVYGIVQQHQGWVEVGSTLGQGTTLSVYLPASDQPLPVTPPAPAPEAMLATGAETILLVEDEPPVRALIRECLERSGYRVLEAATGPEAIALWAQHRAQIDLLFTDLVMPGGLDGRELALLLRQEKPGLRVIYASGYGRNVSAEELPGSVCLAKPFDLAQLVGSVRASLDRPAGENARAGT